MSASPALPNRHLSLDVFRGITLALMILVNTPGDGRHVYAQLRHVRWDGWTLTDCVFPAFVWIIGVAVALVLPRRLASGMSRSAVLGQAAKRAAILFALGVFLYAFPHFPLDTFRILGVLQRLAICYFATVAVMLVTGVRGQLLTSAALLGGYWLLMKTGSSPGYPPGDLSKEGNLAHYIDSLVLGAHNYVNTKTWDPEGVLSTIPAIASCLLGALAGQFLRIRPLLASGVVLASAGLIADSWFPINKMLWSPSFVLLMAGLDSILLAALLWIVDEKGAHRLFTPFRWLGMNAIVLYLASEFLEIMLSELDWKTPLYQTLFASWASPINASLFYALTYTALHVLLAWWLYRRQTFIRV